MLSHNFDFCPKLLFWLKISFFDQKFSFLDKNFDFFQFSNSFSGNIFLVTEFFCQIFNFCPFFSFCPIFNFCPIPNFYVLCWSFIKTMSFYSFSFATSSIDYYLLHRLQSNQIDRIVRTRSTFHFSEFHRIPCT